ncbi:MAG: long-chain fatty acid--CoA ligase [Candidatus Hydrogenedentota bacterium]
MITEYITDAKTVSDLFRRRIAESGSEVAYEQEVDGHWIPKTWDEYGEEVKAFALGLRALGVESGSRAAIWGDTMAQWTIADLGVMVNRGCTAGIYQTCTEEQAAYIISDTAATVVITDTADRLAKAKSVRDETPSVKIYILWRDETDGAQDTYTFDAVCEMGREAAQKDPAVYDALVDAVEPEDTAVLVYTSGTTGPPKGAMLSHTNCLFCSRAVYDRLESIPDQSAVSFLPLSHVAEHVVGFIGRLFGGTKAYFLDDMFRFAEVAQAKGPTLIGGVPRIYEKAHAAILGRVESAPPARQKIFHWAIGVGHEAAQYRMADESIPVVIALKFKIADALVLTKIRAALGGKANVIVCGAAPIAQEIVIFFNAINIPFYEVYGMTESSGISHMNGKRDYKLNTVGMVVKGFECVIAEDGEILVRGDGVFQGYLNQPEATAETIDEDGWLHTGDIGEVDADGFLRITDRKKNLLITAGGKNVAPSNIELLITREPIISQVVVIGDRRRFLSALITLSTEGLEELRESDEFSGMSVDEIRETESIQSRIEDSVNQANSELARYENIRKYEILPEEFTIESGELTPTMKIKRRVVFENYDSVIEGFYAEA